MKVAFVSQPFDSVVPPVQGGSLAIWTYQVAKRLRDCAVTIHARQDVGQLAAERHEQIHYRRFSVARYEDQTLKLLKLVERALGHPRPKRPLFSSPLYYGGYALQVARSLRDQQCDIVHIHNFSQFAPIIRAFNPRIKIVLHMNCEWLTQLDYSMVESRLSSTDLIIGCSHYIADKIRQRFPHMADKCQVIFNGADTNCYIDTNWNQPTRPPKKQRRLLFVGRVSPEKGVHVLIEAFVAIARQHPDLKLEIAGFIASAPFEYMVLVSDDNRVKNLETFYRGRLRRSDYGARLQSLIPADLAGRVHFIGPVPHATILSYYHDADVLINPSLSESFGMSLVEAMAHGVPVIATCVGGMVEIVEMSKGGILAEPDDPRALADAILQLLSDEELRRSMGAAGQQSIPKHFSWDKIAEDLSCLYSRLKVRL